MGQRHQYYVKLPYEVSIDEGYTKDGSKIKNDTIGFHQQWGYGYIPGKRVEQMNDNFEKQKNLKYSGGAFYKKKPYTASEEDLKQNVKGFIQNNFDSGEFNAVHELSARDIRNPHLVENDDDITIIDVSGEDFKYAHLDLETGEIMDTKAYLERYPKMKEIAPEEYDRMVESTKNIELMNDNDVKEMFPDMYLERMEQFDECKKQRILSDVRYNEREKSIEGNEIDKGVDHIKYDNEGKLSFESEFYKTYEDSIDFKEIARTQDIDAKTYLDNKENLEEYEEELLQNERIDERLRYYLTEKQQEKLKQRGKEQKDRLSL